MSLESELYQVFQESTKKARKPKIVKASAPVSPPASAKITFTLYNPAKSGPNLILQVRETKARVYVWRNGEWSIKTPEEAAGFIAYARAEEKRLQAEAARLWKAQDFVARCRAVRIKKEAATKRDALLASLEESALRMTLKAKTLEERMEVNDQKEALEDQIFDAFAFADYEEFDAFEDVHDVIEFPEIPDAWRIMSANPSKHQYKLPI